MAFYTPVDVFVYVRNLSDNQQRLNFVSHMLELATPTKWVGDERDKYTNFVQWVTTHLSGEIRGLVELEAMGGFENPQEGLEVILCETYEYMGYVPFLEKANTYPA